MRFVVWNCAMALHRKALMLLSLEPDIAVVPESASPARLAAANALSVDWSTAWFGMNPNKGMLVLGRRGHPVEPTTPTEPDETVIGRVRTNGAANLDVLAVWNSTESSLYRAGAGPLLRTLRRLTETGGPLPDIIAGDFNGDPRLATGHLFRSHNSVLEWMDTNGYASGYHAHTGAAHGAEPEPTIYWVKRQKGVGECHCDFVFLSPRLRPALRSCFVGSYEEWIGANGSDHAPVVVDLN